MKISKLLLLILSFLAIAISQIVASDAVLSIDSGGHQAKIGKVIVTKNGDIITASNDKTIRVWDSRAGLEKRKILGQIGAGPEGMIFAIAISSDEKYLAVGGFLNENGNYEYGKIRIYNYQTGKLLNILKSHENAVLDLAFSQDNRYLASASFDTTAKLWDMQDFSLINTIKFHSNDVYATKFITNGKDTYIASAGYDNKIALHTLKGNLIKSYTHNQMLDSLATNGNEIATCGDGNEILIFDNNLNLKTKIQSETKPSGLNYSPNGKYLIAGTQAYPYNINIYDSTKKYSKISSFGKHTNLTMAVAFIDNNTAISAGGDNNEIYIWDIFSKQIKQKIVGTGQRVWSVGINKDNIAFGNIGMTQINQHAELQKSFNLSTKSLKVLNDTYQSNFNRIDSYGLTHSAGGDYGYGDAVLNIQQTGAKITRGSTNGYGHNCYGWWREYIVSGGSNGHLKIYNQNGEEVVNLIGHTGEVWSIALDGDRLVSGSSDQTIRVWDLAQLKNINQNKKELDENIINEVIKVTNWQRSEVIGRADFIKEKTGINIYKTNSIELHPTVTLFIGSDNEWVMWNENGFFDSSVNGAKYIGFHINKGSDKEAEFVSVDKLYKSLYRPDLIAKALNGEDLSQYAKSINIQDILKGGLAPKVAIKTQSGESIKKDVELELEVCETDNNGYANPTLLINGMAVEILDTNRALKSKSPTYGTCHYFKPLISLQSGINNIGFKATNKTGTIESNTDSISISYNQKSNKKPDLYILTIGIDKYRDGDLQLKYSVADAKDIAYSIEKNANKLFENIYSYSIFDKDVTKENILKTMKSVGEKSSRDDVFVLYIAGHGITDTKTGSYFYLPSDFRYKNEDSVRLSAVSQDDFTLAYSYIKALKSVTFIDTCNSGSFAEALASRGVLQKTAIDKLTRATGRATIVASSKDQAALEGYEGHGVFTYTLIEAINDKAYKDGKVTVKSIASYIEDILPERTYRKWGYEQVPQSHITGTDFPIGVK